MFVSKDENRLNNTIEVETHAIIWKDTWDQTPYYEDSSMLFKLLLSPIKDKIALISISKETDRVLDNALDKVKD